MLASQLRALLFKSALLVMLAMLALVLASPSSVSADAFYIYTTPGATVTSYATELDVANDLNPSIVGTQADESAKGLGCAHAALCAILDGPEGPPPVSQTPKITASPSAAHGRSGGAGQSRTIYRFRADS